MAMTLAADSRSASPVSFSMTLALKSTLAACGALPATPVELPAVRNWNEAIAQVEEVYGSSLPGLTDEEWSYFARCGYRENEAGVPVPDVTRDRGRVQGDPQEVSLTDGSSSGA